MAVSKKDFRAIAEALAWTIGQDQSDNPVHDPIDYLLDELVFQLHKLNRRFDEDKFREYITKRSIEVRDNLNEINELDKELV